MEYYHYKDEKKEYPTSIHTHTRCIVGPLRVFQCMLLGIYSVCMKDTEVESNAGM